MVEMLPDTMAYFILCFHKDQPWNDTGLLGQADPWALVEQQDTSISFCAKCYIPIAQTYPFHSWY